MLKKWECTNCYRIVLAFEEDIANKNENSFEIIRASKFKDCVCVFKELPNFEASTLHGEAGFMTEGTVLDSMDTIHDYEKVCTEKAADARELKQYLDAMKNR